MRYHKVFYLIMSCFLTKPQTCIGQVFIPDTTVNRILVIDDYVSVEKHLGDIMDGTDHNASLPDIYFLNKSSTQYLRLIFFPGSTRNAFQRFEIGMKSSRINGTILKQFVSFKTESNISIGSSITSVITRKGKNYTKKKRNGFIVLLYKLNGLSEHPFLKEHNNPFYSAEYHFKNGRLYKLSYGIV